MNVERRERIPKFGFEMAVSKGRQMEQLCDSTVVKAPIQIPFFYSVYEKFKEREERIHGTDCRRGRWVTRQVSREISKGMNSRVVLRSSLGLYIMMRFAEM